MAPLLTGSHSQIHKLTVTHMNTSTRWYIHPSYTFTHSDPHHHPCKHTVTQTHSNPGIKLDLTWLMGRGDTIQSGCPSRPCPLRSSESWDPPLQAEPPPPRLSVSSWSQVLNVPQKGTGHPGVLGRRRGWCAGKKGAGHSTQPGRSRLLPRDFPSRLAQAREERARFVSRPAPGMFPRKLSAPRPEPPLPWPRPPPSGWRRPASAATAALSYRGCLGRAQKHGSRSRRRAPWKQVSVARSGALPA